jgi:AcrR family transcriptional regulator
MSAKPPAQPDRRPDRRIDRTQRALTGAMLALLQERDWTEISVQALCDRADVARATFYARFDSKQDLLDALFWTTEAEVRAAVAPLRAGGQAFPVLHWLVQHSHEGRGFHRKIKGSAAGMLIQSRFRQAMGELLAEDLREAGFTPDPLSLAMLHGAVFAAIEHWLALPPERAGSPTEMSQDLAGQLAAMARALPAVVADQTPA